MSVGVWPDGMYRGACMSYVHSGTVKSWRTAWASWIETPWLLDVFDFELEFDHCMFRHLLGLPIFHGPTFGWVVTRWLGSRGLEVVRLTKGEQGRHPGPGTPRFRKQVELMSSAKEESAWRRHLRPGSTSHLSASPSAFLADPSGSLCWDRARGTCFTLGICLAALIFLFWHFHLVFPFLLMVHEFFCKPPFG